MLASQGLKFCVFFFRVYCVVFVTYNVYVVMLLLALRSGGKRAK